MYNNKKLIVDNPKCCENNFKLTFSVLLYYNLILAIIKFYDNYLYLLEDRNINFLWNDIILKTSK